MSNVRIERWIILPGVVALLMAGSACASKKFVLTKLNPLSHRVDTVEKQANETGKDVTELQTEVSRNSERIMTADLKAQEAAKDAEAANRLARDAGATATENGEQLTSLDRRLGEQVKRFEERDNYELTTTKTVHFGFSQSALSREAKAVLDELAGMVPQQAPYVVEIRGFTDKSGSREYNLALSRRRADAVARYLTSAAGIPLRRLHILGMGDDAPASDNGTREGRKRNRRVEVSLYSSPLTRTASRSGSGL